MQGEDSVVFFSEQDKLDAAETYAVQASAMNIRANARKRAEAYLGHELK